MVQHYYSYQGTALQETIKKINKTEEMKLEISIRISHLIFYLFISFVCLEERNDLDLDNIISLL